MYDIIIVKHVKEYFPPTSLNCREILIGFAQGLVVHENILMYQANSAWDLKQTAVLCFLTTEIILPKYTGF